MEITQPGEAIRRKIRFDESEQKLIVESFQPGVDEILAANRALLNAERRSSSLWDGRTMVHVGRIPLVLLEQWHREGCKFGSHEMNARIVKTLNDRDYSELRTAPGRI